MKSEDKWMELKKKIILSVWGNPDPETDTVCALLQVGISFKG